MTVLTRQRWYVPLIVGVLGAYPMACREEVSLGAWGSRPDAAATTGTGTSTVTGTGGNLSTGVGTVGSAGAPATDGPSPPPELPGCLEPGEPGPLNLRGAALGATETDTDWNWPESHTSLEFDIMVEREIEKDPTATAATRGYYWAHQFGFAEGASGWFGMQAEGVYQRDLSDPETREVTKMVAFWLSGPPVAAELGDIQPPDARIADITASSVTYTTIHAKFNWQACRVYRFRIAQESVESDGNIWYGAWIEDVDAGLETFLGRMLMPADTGAFSKYSRSRTLPIEFREPDTCDIPQASALFGIPHNEEGDIYAVGSNSFGDPPLACPSSRFTVFPGAVRHEQGVRP